MGAIFTSFYCYKDNFVCEPINTDSAFSILARCCQSQYSRSNLGVFFLQVGNICCSVIMDDCRIPCHWANLATVTFSFAGCDYQSSPSECSIFQSLSGLSSIFWCFSFMISVLYRGLKIVSAKFQNSWRSCPLGYRFRRITSIHARATRARADMENSARWSENRWLVSRTPQNRLSLSIREYFLSISN